MVNIIVIITVNTKPITFTDKVGIDKAVVARTDIEALATIVEALIKGIIKDK